MTSRRNLTPPSQRPDTRTRDALRDRQQRSDQVRRAQRLDQLRDRVDRDRLDRTQQGLRERTPETEDRLDRTRDRLEDLARQRDRSDSIRDRNRDGNRGRDFVRDRDRGDRDFADRDRDRGRDWDRDGRRRDWDRDRDWSDRRRDWERSHRDWVQHRHWDRDHWRRGRDWNHIRDHYRHVRWHRYRHRYRPYYLALGFANFPYYSRWWYDYYPSLQTWGPQDYTYYSWYYVVPSYPADSGVSSIPLNSGEGWHFGVKGLVLPGQGIAIDQVDPGSPAERAGLEPGMILVKANGIELTDADTLSVIIAESGGVLELEVLPGPDTEPQLVMVELQLVETARY